MENMAMFLDAKMNSATKKLRYLPLVAFCYVLAACTTLTTHVDTSPLVHLTDAVSGGPTTSPALIEYAGKPAVLYVNRTGRMSFKYGDTQRLVDDTARVKGGNYLQLHDNDGQLSALWWSHQDGKNIYFTKTNDLGKTFSKVAMVNEDHGVLPPFTFTHQGSVLGLTYQDERIPNYQVYFNRSVDKGATWNAKDVRLDAVPVPLRSTDVHEPQTVQAGDTWVSVWNDIVNSNGQREYRIIVRRSYDAGATWGNQNVIATSQHQFSGMQVKADKQQAVIVADELNSGLMALVSKDAGETWLKAGLLPDQAKASNSGIQIEIAKDNCYAVWIQTLPESKARIALATLNLQSGQWQGAAQRLDTKEWDNTRSIMPVLGATKRGTLVAAWTDYRDIRPNIYLSLLPKGSTVWTKAQPLLKPGSLSAGWPRLIPWQDQLALSYEVYPKESILDGHFIARRLSFNDDETQLLNLESDSVTGQDRQRLLNERVNKLWGDRMAANYEPNYDMFDFAYRAATPKSVYMGGVGVITYLDYKLESIKVQGNEATVEMSLKYEVKPVMIPNVPKPISMAPVEVKLTNKWVWVQDNWYLVYVPFNSSGLLEY